MSENKKPPVSGDEEKSEEERKIEAARILGMNVPDGSTLIGGESIAFGVTPDGVEGGKELSGMLATIFIDARTAGAPPEALSLLGSNLLGAFALAISSSLAGAEEIDEKNPLARLWAMKNQTREQRIELAIGLTEMTATSLSNFSTWSEEEEFEETEETPGLVDWEAAQELKRLFEAEGEDNG